MLQHNFVTLQTQMARLQHENAKLTQDLCLKENYIQLKDQQFRVMQRRLEELETTVAHWKNRWLQQVNACQSTSKTGQDVREKDVEGQVEDRRNEAEWTLWTCKLRGTSRVSALAQAHKQLEKFSQTDRNKLQPLLAAIEQHNSSKIEDLVFTDVSDELSRILFLYLLPALLNAVENSHQVQCFSRVYRKQTMDCRVCTTTQAQGTTETEKALGNKPPPSALVVQGGSFAERNGNPVALEVQAVMETEEIDAPHLFDCVELDRRGSARTPIPHGLRELHATKAMFISRPLSGSAAVRSAISLLEKPLEKASRCYTLTPKYTDPAVETTRTYTINMGALPSPAQSPSPVGLFPFGSDGELIPTPPREKEGKDGKIKKIVGSMFDRLSRHKSQQSLTTTSSSHASPLPLGMLVGSTEVEDETVCDGCGRGPLVGMKWVCRTCRLLADDEYELCEKCYGHGIHGKEHEDALFARVETIVVRKCPRLANETELLHLLRVGICKANLKKFSFCLTWIADLLQCSRTTDLRARALEIAHISPTVRSDFTRLLRELLTRYRPDIELRTEWEPAAGAQHGSFGPGTPAMRCENAPDELDTLRVWVKDAPLAATVTTGGTNTGISSLC